jgi:hypothetical protein
MSLRGASPAHSGTQARPVPILSQDCYRAILGFDPLDGSTHVIAGSV